MNRVLYPYQKKIVDYIKTTEHPALWVSMRLGKTLCTIRALKDLPGRKLIVCPKSVIPTWCDELNMERISSYGWANTTDYKQFYLNNGIQFGLPDWVIVNYEAVTKFPYDNAAYYDYVVIDESVRLKNPQAKLTKFLLNNFRNAKKRICLSGNPAPNTPLDYFTQFQFLKNEWMGCNNYWKFRHRYFASDLQGWAWWTRKGSDEVIRKGVQENSYVLTRKDVGVANQKVYEKRVVSMPAKLEKEYKRMEKEFVAKLPDGKEIETKWVLAQLIYLQEMAGGHLLNQEVSDFKVKELINLLEGELKGEQVLIWCRFRWEIEAIMKKVIGAEFINGDVPLDERKKIQDKFNGGKFNVLIMQIATGRYGLNLSSADTCIYFSNTFSYDDRSQSEARIESNTKRTPLLYIDLVTKNSIDEDLLKSLKKKEKHSKFFLNSVVENIKERNK